jgi:hypothetical protein
MLLTPSSTDIPANTTGNTITLLEPFLRKSFDELTGLFVGEGFHLDSNGGVGDIDLSRLPAAKDYKGGRYNKFHGTIHSVCDFKIN